MLTISMPLLVDKYQLVQKQQNNFTGEYYATNLQENTHAEV